MGEYLEVQAFVPVKKTDPKCLYLKDNVFTIHASQILEFTHLMTQINDYGRSNPKKRRIFRPVKSGEKVEMYGPISTQIPPC